jgi:hypothetical protein
MIVRYASVVVALVPMFVGLADAQAQRQGPQQSTPRNLQVLAQDTPQADVVATMQNIAASLGVQCAHCHVQAAPPAGGRRGAPEGAQTGRGGRGAAAPFDYASDEKPQKKIARDMMLMVRDMNAKVATAVGKPSDTIATVGCVTCHRGVAIPRQLPELLDATARDNGTPAALAQYKTLRRQYFGAQAYDFSEPTLIAYAQRALQANRTDDAIAWLQLNLEYYPRSPRTYAALAQAQLRKGDKAAATRSLEKAAELDPQNAQVQRELDQLKKN